MLGVVACADNARPGPDELITRLAPAQVSLPADGTSTTTVTLCAAQDAGLDPALPGTLAASLGGWVAAPDGGTQRTSFMFDRDGCRAIAWQAPTTVGTAVITATVGAQPFAVATTSVALTAVALAKPVLAIAGQRSKTDVATITVTAKLRAATGGPTLSSTVDFAVTGNVPAYFAAPQQVLTAGDTVSSTLVVAAAASGTVTIAVTATPPTVAGQPAPTPSEAATLDLPVL